MNKIISSSRETSNRANAAKSTGPKTEAGKSISSHNALKTGLTGRTVLLPTDDVAVYKSHLESLNDRYQPKTSEERLHVQTIAHIEWRLLRIPTLETGLLAIGRKRFADCHPDEPEEIRTVMIEAEVMLEYQKQLANLALQESRLHRQHERETATLQALRTARLAQEAVHLKEAARLFLHCKKTGETFFFNDLALFGFDFSMEQIHRRAAEMITNYDKVDWPTIQANYHFRKLQAA